jgi:hypothetical protein
MQESNGIVSVILRGGLFDKRTLRQDVKIKTDIAVLHVGITSCHCHVCMYPSNWRVNLPVDSRTFDGRILSE